VTLTELANLLVECGAVPRAGVDGMRESMDDDAFAARLVSLVTENEDVIAELLAERTQHPAIIFGASTVDLGFFGLVDEDLLLAHEMLPVANVGGTVTVVVADPNLAGSSVLRELGAALGRRTAIVVCVPQLLRVAITRAAQRHDEGERVLRGSRSQDDVVALALARPPIKAKLPRADSVAKALNSILDGVGERRPPELKGGALAALKLKQIPMTVPVPSPAPVITPAAPEPKKLVERESRRPFVLVVEDDDEIAHLIGRALAADGCDALHVASGDAVATAIGERRPDLIVLDAMLPGVHGFEICAGLKQSDDWRAVPILMVSAVYSGFERAREIQEKHGADAFIEKPFQFEHLRRLVADLLERPAPQRAPSTNALTEARARALVDHHLTVGDETAAAGVIEQWLTAAPLSARAWLEQGHLAALRGDALVALRAYEHAALYDRRLFIAQVSLAMLYEQLGFVRRAKHTWRAAAACAPDGALAQRLRATL